MIIETDPAPAVSPRATPRRIPPRPVPPGRVDPGRVGSRRRFGSVLVVAGLVVVGAGVGVIPLSWSVLGSGVARADPPPQQWAQLRQCESSGRYDAVADNGHYGAYQFDLATWNSVGGNRAALDGLPRRTGLPGTSALPVARMAALGMRRHPRAHQRPGRRHRPGTQPHRRAGPSPPDRPAPARPTTPRHTPHGSTCHRSTCHSSICLAVGVIPRLTVTVVTVTVVTVAVAVAVGGGRVAFGCESAAVAGGGLRARCV